ncbi:MAG: hypothetical protein RSC84_03255 [Peptostreptococcaceae bacterium]
MNTITEKKRVIDKLLNMDRVQSTKDVICTDNIKKEHEKYCMSNHGCSHITDCTECAITFVISHYDVSK